MSSAADAPDSPRTAAVARRRPIAPWVFWPAATVVVVFSARVSRGRTVRQFVMGVLLVPTMLGILPRSSSRSRSRSSCCSCAGRRSSPSSASGGPTHARSARSSSSTSERTMASRSKSRTCAVWMRRGGCSGADEWRGPHPREIYRTSRMHRASEASESAPPPEAADAAPPQIGAAGSGCRPVASNVAS